VAHCETDREAVGEMIRQFDSFFEETHRETLRSYPSKRDLAAQLQVFYDEAVAQESKDKENHVRSRSSRE
jgi:hypothetical protein